MIPKSGHRFSEKDHAPTKKLEQDDDSKKSHPLAGGALTESRSRQAGGSIRASSPSTVAWNASQGASRSLWLRTMIELPA